MTRIMRDSATIAYINPADVQLLGYYVDGAYVPSAGQLARFTGKVLVPISVNPHGNNGVVGDGPPDNGAWGDWVDWVVRRRQWGVNPTMYTNQSSWATGVAAFNARGVTPPQWWIANWDGQATMIPGAVAHQFENVGNQYDTSVVADYWPGVDPVPHNPGPPPPPGSGGGGPPPPPPPPPNPFANLLEEDVLLVQNPQDWFLLSGSLYAWIPSNPDLAALQGAGIKSVTVSAAQHDSLLKAAAALSGTLGGSLAVSGSLTVS